MSGPIEIVDSWAAAIRRHECLVLEVPRAHGSTSFLQSVLRYATKPCFMLTRQHPRGRQQKGVRTVHEQPPHGFRGGMLLLDRLIHVSPSPRDRHVKAALQDWLDFTKPSQVIAVVTDDPRCRQYLLELFPRTWDRIRYSYTWDLTGVITENGVDVGLFESALWCKEELYARQRDLGAERFANAYQVREPPKHCGTCDFAHPGECRMFDTTANPPSPCPAWGKKPDHHKET